MLKGISPVVSPDLLKTLAEMGHGDEIVIADAHFPGHTFNSRVLRADGLDADQLLAGIIPLFELDAYATPVIMMEAVPGDTLDPSVEARYRKALGYDGIIERVERARKRLKRAAEHARIKRVPGEMGVRNHDFIAMAHFGQRLQQIRRNDR